MILEPAKEPFANVEYSLVVPSLTLVVYRSTFSTTHPPAGGPSVSTVAFGSKNTTLSPILYGFRTNMRRIPYKWVVLVKMRKVPLQGTHPYK
jgi:hypothetical protein